MQLLIVILLALIVFILAPWMLGVAITGAMLYGVWIAVAAAVICFFGIVGAIAGSASAPSHQRKGAMTNQEMNERNIRINREREAAELAAKESQERGPVDRPA